MQQPGCCSAAWSARIRLNPPSRPTRHHPESLDQAVRSQVPRRRLQLAIVSIVEILPQRSNALRGAIAVRRLEAALLHLISAPDRVLVHLNAIHIAKLAIEIYAFPQAHRRMHVVHTCV